MREFLIKTFKESDYQYAQALLKNGELFFQHVNNYREMEEDIQRSDFDEGTAVDSFPAHITPNVDFFYIKDPDGKKFYLDWAAAKKAYPFLQKGHIHLQLSYVVDWLIYSMTYINSSTFDRQKIFETIAKLGKYSVVILDCNSFIKSVEQKVKIVKRGLISYVEDKIIDPFTKRKAAYFGQNEYRFAISANGATTKTIQVGPVSGFICESKNIPDIERYL